MIVMTMVAAAIGVAVSAALLTVIGNMNTAENGVRFRANGDSFNEEVRALLSSQASCFKSLGGIQVSSTGISPVAALKDSGGNVVYQAGQIYMDRTLTLKKIEASGYKQDGSLSQGTITLTQYFESAKPMTGSKAWARAINVSVQVDASNRILSCIALSRMTDGIWRVSQADTNNIYFPGTLPEGRVGIGTNDPVSLLEVQGNGNASALPNFPAIRVKNTNPSLAPYLSSTNNFAAFQFHAGNGATQGQLSAQYMSTPGGSIAGAGNISLWAKTYGTAMTFVTAHGPGSTQSDYGEKMRIDYTGLVGIGTDTPRAILELSANETSNKSLPTLLIPNEAQHPGGAGIWFKNAYGSPDSRIYQGTGGNLNIVMGSGSYVKFLTNSNFAAAIDRNGSYSASDRRLKTDIKPVEDVLEKLSHVPAVTYLWKDEDPLKTRPHVGIIAQDLQTQFPLLVTEIENPKKGSSLKKILTVDYGHLTSIVIQAVNELRHAWMSDSDEIHSQLNELKAEISQLKRENEKLRENAKAAH